MSTKPASFGVAYFEKQNHIDNPYNIGYNNKWKQCYIGGVQWIH